MKWDELEKAAKAATPGPWIAAGPSFGGEFPVYCEEVLVDREHDDDDGYGICQAPTGLEKESTHDMSYIAAANPAAILELLSELRRLAAVEAELEALKKAISEAEPVVWANPNGGFLSDTYINQFATGLEKQTHTIPLYTLKGIK